MSCSRSHKKASARELAHVDYPGPPRVGRYGVDLDGFERLALPARAAPAEIVLIDELGKMELASDAFVGARRGPALRRHAGRCHGPSPSPSVADLVHFHLAESHRGVPGRGTVDWEAIMGALVDGGYTGYVGLESFAEVADSMRGATCIWRDLAPDSDTLVTEGLTFLRGLEQERRATG